MKVNSIAFAIILILAGAGCRAMPATSGVTVTPDMVRAEVVASEAGITDFGWLPDGRVFYGIGGRPDIDRRTYPEDIDATRWFAADPEGQGAVEIPRPYPALDERQVQSLGEDQLRDVTLSPSGEKALYTRLPDGFQRPEDIFPHYFDPMEIWAAEDLANGGNSVFPILNDPDRQHDCGISLSRESIWYEDESLVLGSCYFDSETIRVYFLADLTARSIQFLDFQTEDGEYLPSEDIAAAHANPALAFRSAGRLWLVTAEPGSRQVSLTLTPQNVLSEDRPVIAPVWSADDKWIYYWTIGEAEQSGAAEYKRWWLERIDPETGTMETVLSEQELLAVMGEEMYGVSHGAFLPWRLSEDQTRILLFMHPTNDSPAALLLITF